MLRGTLAFLVLVVLAAAIAEGRRALLRRGWHAPAYPRLPFLLLGFFLGDHVLGLFPPDVLAALRPVVLLGLAWIGLVFGLQVDLRILARLKPWHRRLGFGLPLLPGAAATGAALAFSLPVPLALGLGAIAMVSSPAILEAVGRGRPPSDRATARLLRMLAATSGLPAVVLLGVTTAAWGAIAASRGGPVPSWQAALLPFAIGAVCGWTLVVLVRGVADRVRLLGLLFGVAAVLAGVAAVLGIAALPAAAVAGAVLANRAMLPHRILKVAHVLDAPLLVALLVLVGASWTEVAFSWPTLVVLVVARAAGLAAAGRVLAAVARRRGVALAARQTWCGLLAQGELALGLSLVLIGTVADDPGVLAAAVAALLVNHGLAVLWTRRELFPANPGRLA